MNIVVSDCISLLSLNDEPWTGSGFPSLMMMKMKIYINVKYGENSGIMCHQVPFYLRLLLQINPFNSSSTKKIRSNPLKSNIALKS